jgi:adenylate kinase
MVKNFIFLGPPGSGKGSLAKKVQKELNTLHISTGDIFRNEITNKTTLGKKVQSVLSSGSYVKDKVTNEIVKKRLAKQDILKKGFILDGYPRTINQSKFLSDQNIKIDYVILLVVSKSVLIKRLSGRRVCPKCSASYHIDFLKPKKANICDLDGIKLIQRPDDSIDSIKKRLLIYKKQTKRLIKYYKTKGLLVKLNSSKLVDTTYDLFKEACYDSN